MTGQDLSCHFFVGGGVESRGGFQSGQILPVESAQPLESAEVHQPGGGGGATGHGGGLAPTQGAEAIGDIPCKNDDHILGRRDRLFAPRLDQIARDALGHLQGKNQHKNNPGHLLPARQTNDGSHGDEASGHHDQRAQPQRSRCVQPANLEKCQPGEHHRHRGRDEEGGLPGCRDRGDQQSGDGKNQEGKWRDRHQQSFRML